MNTQLHLADTWYLAMTLSERLRSHARPALDLLENTHGTPNYRFCCWRSQQPFEVEEVWTRRLAVYGLTNEEFLHILSEPASTVRSRFTETPVWLSAFQEAYRDFPTTSEVPVSSLRTARNERFTEIAEPLVKLGMRRLQESIAGLLERFPDAPFGTNITDELRSCMAVQLAPMLVRTMALELNVARLEGRLAGVTAEERLDSFIRSLRDSRMALEILGEYPVLARQLTETVIQSVNRNLEALERLCHDWDEIRSRLLCGNCCGRLIRLTSTSGDTHRGGRAVLFAEFESGARVVYKPRSLAVELHFQKLLEWLNGHGASQPFRTLKVIERGEYGWVEFVSAQECNSAAEVGRFYERQGAYLALLYALEATDLHHENLLAAGEHPVLIDLEALFHPRFGENQATDAIVVAQNELSHSVLRVGLLPLRLWANDETEGVDLSGLSTEGEQLSPLPVPTLEGVGTDEMHLVSKRVSMAISAHRPTIKGSQVSLADYTDSVLGGFTRMYHLLMRHREELLEKSGPIDQFSTDEVRVVLLPTQTYGILLRESFHPDVLRDALDRDRLFDTLWTEAAARPDLEKVMPVQLRDLSHGDVPIFTTRPESRDLWSSLKERLPNYLEECPMESVRNRLCSLSEEDLGKQLWVIRATLATLSKETDRLRLSSYSPTKPEGVLRPGRLISAAKKAGDWLNMQARQGEDDAAWIGLTLGRDRRWSLSPAGVDLYDGLPGIALFLAELGAVTSEHRYTRLAERAVTSLLHTVQRNAAAITSIGGFTGWGGLMYAFSRLAALWRREDLWKEAGKAAERIPELIERDDVLDIIGGAAGSIGTLLGLYRSGGSASALDAAIRCGEHLLERARPAGEGLAWPAGFGSQKPLTGFSHGAAGMAWALRQLACVSGERRFSEGAAGAVAYEHALFDPQHSNWPDLRDQDLRGAEFSMAWCHGAPGIGLARLSSLSDGDEIARMEIESALNATVAAGAGYTHCLCHGDLGNLDLLIEASRRPLWSAWRSEAEHLAAVVLTDIEHNGWRCGLSLDVQSPGLMTGVAGIGYQLLRLADPERVPSVLVFGHVGGNEINDGNESHFSRHSAACAGLPQAR
jgi:class II lanthipeptide synthase